MAKQTKNPPDATGARADRPAVLGAGAIVWRDRGKGIEVLLIHRPRYDDWSFPKGKLEPGESSPVAAVREVREETGYKIQLRHPLPNVTYRLKEGREKIVRYWVGSVEGKVLSGPVNKHEVDSTHWTKLPEAAEILTRQADRSLLESFVELATGGALAAVPVGFQRHGSARSRKRWKKGEATRPLSSKGRRQAHALVPLLAAYAPNALVTSPWKRCMQTVDPFAKASGTALETRERLSEEGNAGKPSKTAALIASILTSARPLVICTHRPVLPTILDVLRENATDRARAQLPESDPYLAAGELLIAHVLPDGRIVYVEQHQPILED